MYSQHTCEKSANEAEIGEMASSEGPDSRDSGFLRKWQDGKMAIAS